MIPKGELIKYFLSELEDNINGLINELKDLQTNGFKLENIDTIYRIAHTIKGTASLVNFNKIALLAHKLEEVFELLINNKIGNSVSVVYISEKLLNLIIKLFNEVSVYKEEKTEIDVKFLQLIDELLENKGLVKSELPYESSESLPLINSIKVEPEITNSLFESLGEMIVAKRNLKFIEDKLKTFINEALNRVENLSKEIKAFFNVTSFLLTKDNKIDKTLCDFNDLELDTKDYYRICSKKIPELTNDVAENLKELLMHYENLSLIFKNLSEEIDALKNKLLSLRLLPIGLLLNKFPEPIKNFAKELGKDIEIYIEGGDIKIDKPALDLLYEPLMHILKNAVIHGIETPVDRLLSGKSEKGKIDINVKKKGKYVVISIKDDGRGIDIDKVREIALKKGLLNIEELSIIEDREILPIIFYPKFSTSESSDFHSGRGIGLDIAKRAILRLNGTIDVFSESQKSTTFLIKIPQSQFLWDLLIFSNFTMEFAVPIDFIEEILHEEDFPNVKIQRAINHRNKTIPVKIFESSCMKDGKGKKGYIIVFNFSGMHRALLVENISRQEETIVYPLGDFLEGLSQYLGYFLSAEGVPIFVINPFKIFEDEVIFQISKSQIQNNKIYKGTVLIVDDSLSVRKYLKSFLENENFKVYTAQNGVEALSILKEHNVDLVIADLEMPVMHGYTFIKILKKDSNCKDLPIVVFTTKDTEKYREKAFNLKVDTFLTKPFCENQVRETINKFFNDKSL